MESGVVEPKWDGPVAKDWPKLLEILEQRVKPERDRDNRENYRRLWWQFAERRPGLMRALRGMNRQLAHPYTSPHMSFAFVPSSTIVAGPHIVIALEEWASFAVLQSRVHELWTRFMSSSFKDDLRYALSDCLETFPFPSKYHADDSLNEVGEKYYEFRASLMVHNNEGLTATYNRFHSPDEHSADIIELRHLHDKMDCAVLRAYGWKDLHPACNFFPEFDDEEQEDDDSRPGRGRRKKFRYRWPDQIHDEVLARLLALNRDTAVAQKRPEPAPRTSTKTSDTKKSKLQSQNPGLF